MEKYSTCDIRLSRQRATMENARRDLIKRIINECKENGAIVTKDLVSFLLSLLQLKSTYQIKEDDEGNDARIIQAMTQKLCDQTRPSLIVIKNQLYFAKHYLERDETIKKHRLRLHQKTGPLVMEICATTKIENGRESEKLYQKILVVIALLSGLGNPTVPSILREVSVALQSVFQPSELLRYVVMTKREKEEQLMELMCIVAGIRLFNKDCQRGGEGIDDLPTILQEGVKKTRDTIVELLERLMLSIYKLTAIVEKTVTIRTTIGESDPSKDVKRTLLPDGYTDDNVAWAIEMLTASRQQEIYVRKLLADVGHCDNEIKQLLERLQGRLFKLHDTVRYRTAIPTIQVYPQFIDLADIWMGLQDEVIILSSIDKFLWELESLSKKNINVCGNRRLDDMLAIVEIFTDAERLERTMGKLITECGECSLYYPNLTKDFEEINLEFLGFCAWTFVVGKGALLPGNPNNGVAKWRGKYYAFSSAKAAESFGEDPDRYIYEGLDFVRDHPEYVYLFQLYDDVHAIKSQEILSRDGPRLKIRYHRMIQTDVHILPPCIDKTYASNIWELRQEALRLASISRCATRSTQTHKSNFRYGAYVQAASPRNKEVQTRRDNYTNTKKLKTFIFGLRGRRDDNQHVISFLEEEFEHL
ncbi:hypothetical protein KM043_006136 [Ampulex compressa]|nr:hypothetical protein KM043_006136 [Ampulex compressa]